MADEDHFIGSEGGTLEDFLEELGIRDEVYASAIKKLKLSELLGNMKPEHRHDEVDFGKSEGKEVW